MSPKGPPSFFFPFCNRKDAQKFQRPTFYIFRHYATYRRLQKNFEKIFGNFCPHSGTVEESTWHLEVLLLFLSLRYVAYFGRSRLVAQNFTLVERVKEKLWFVVSENRGAEQVHKLARPPGEGAYGASVHSPSHFRDPGGLAALPDHPDLGHQGLQHQVQTQLLQLHQSVHLPLLHGSIPA